MKSDRIVIICAVLLAAVYAFATEQIPTLEIGDPMGAKAIPRLLTVALLVSAGLLWLESRIAAKNPAPAESVEPAGARHYRWVIFVSVLWTVLYFAVFESVGYAISTSIYLLALMAYFNRGRWMVNVLSAVLFSFGSYLAFTRFFGSTLPSGILPF
jgi:putative tricarboxylic transport membrane protein